MPFTYGDQLVDITLMPTHEVEIDVTDIHDRDTNKERSHGLPVVRKLEELSSVDAVVITDSHAPQAAFDLVRRSFEEAQILAPSFLRITRSPLDFKPKMEQR